LTAASIWSCNSDASAQHIEDYSTSPQPAFLAVPFQAIAPQQLGSPVDDAIARFIPDPFLDSPLRPPAQSLGLAAGGALHSLSN
jgi:hypothetical protein